MARIADWRYKINSETLLKLLFLLAALALMLIGLALPLYTMLLKSLQNSSGEFIGLMNYRYYFSTPALVNSILNSFSIALMTTLLVVVLAFLCAYGITRTCMPGKKLFRTLTLLPILAPSLLPAISLVYIFGTQGYMKSLLGDTSIYGPVGIVIGMCFWIFPHALMILITALSNSDARLYEAAKAMKTSTFRTFMTVTLPGVRYGLMSCAFVVFTLAIPILVCPRLSGASLAYWQRTFISRLSASRTSRWGRLSASFCCYLRCLPLSLIAGCNANKPHSCHPEPYPINPNPHQCAMGCLPYFAMLLLR